MCGKTNVHLTWHSRVGTTSLWDAKCTYFRACSPNISKDWNLNLFWRETGIFSISAARVCHWVSRTECTRSRVIQIPEQEGRFKSHSFEKLGQQAQNYVVFVSLCRFLPTLGTSPKLVLLKWNQYTSPQLTFSIFLHEKFQREYIDSFCKRKNYEQRPFFLPWNMGQILPKAPIGPWRVYCPAVNSMKSNGSPQKHNMIQYGIKKAPPPDL